MRTSKYNYFFENEHSIIGYSWLSNQYISFDKKLKGPLEKLLDNPDNVMTNSDVTIYKELAKKKFVIPDGFDEYTYLMNLHRQIVYRKDKLAFAVMPTMACNLRCIYCYETHPNINNSQISQQVVTNLKKYIQARINKINELNISWFGGEPLYMSDFVVDFSTGCKTLCQQHDVMYSSSMSSNGVLLSKKVSERLSSAGIHSIQVTIDGYKKNHDITRITINKKGTFDIILTNIVSFLETHDKNNITLRIHFPATADENYLCNTSEMLQMFPQDLRQRIHVYFHIVYDACTDKWADDKFYGNNTTEINCAVQKTNSPVNNIDDILFRIREIAFNLSFKTSKPSSFRDFWYCTADLDWFWAIRPDGYLTKCTIAVERERTQAMLTGNGIKTIGNRLFDYKLKEFSGRLLEKCRDCHYLPLCWGGCAFSVKQSRSIDEYIHKKCDNIENDYIVKRKLNDIQFYYYEQERGNQET